MPTERRFHMMRWSGYTVLTACFLSGFFYRFAPATFAQSLSASLGTSAAQLGVLAAWHFWVYTVAQIPAGLLVDRWGTRLCVSAGSFVTAAGAAAQATAHNLLQASLGPVLTGLGLSVVFVGVMKNNAVWFSARHYGAITGLTMLLANVGSVLAGSPSAWLLHHMSWRTIFASAAVISFLLAGSVALLVRNRPDTTAAPPPRAGGPSAGAWRSIRHVLGRRELWPVFWCTIGTNGTFYAFSGLWGVPVLTDGFHLSNSHAALYTTLALATYGIGSFVIGLVSDRLGRRKPLLLLSSAAALAGWLLLGLAPWRPGWSGMALYLLVGLAAAQVTVSFATLKELVPNSISATVLAVANTGVFAASAVIQPLFGWIVDLTHPATGTPDLHSYRLALLLPVAFSVVGLLGALRATETWCRNLPEESPAPRTTQPAGPLTG
ncbi:MFS transporter [Streptomyces angustmyceticus]|uniref:MFS transporter n=1 Tax=Streptomyces angustmyceticus TaxID=285578 RepID=UPI0021AF9A1F|nr:MFS transporter [Streptomyces angustmyceticus]